LQEDYRAPPSVLAPELTREQARQKLSEGVPLLDREAVDPDIDFCQDLFGRLLNRLQRRSASAEATAAIAHAAAAGEVDVNDALIEALAGHADHVIEIATRALVPSDALVGILELVVRPSLQALASALQ